LKKISGHKLKKKEKEEKYSQINFSSRGLLCLSKKVQLRFIDRRIFCSIFIIKFTSTFEESNKYFLTTPFTLALLPCIAKNSIDGERRLAIKLPRRYQDNRRGLDQQQEQQQQ